MTTQLARQRYLSRVLGLIVGLAGPTAIPAQEVGEPKAKDLHVLFIGNSQVYFNDLPRTVEALAESAPANQPRIRADRFVSGGASLKRLWNAGTGKNTARAKILEKKWDYVILQEIYNVKPADFNEYATLFHELIQKNGSRTVLFCTAGVSQQYPAGFHDLHAMHIALGKKLHVPVAAAGKAWLSYWGDKPTAEQRLALYDPDKAHPGKKGSYIYACTLYAALTRHSPVGLTNRIPNQPADTVTATEAKQFQEAAWRVHQEVNPAAAGPASAGDIPPAFLKKPLSFYPDNVGVRGRDMPELSCPAVDSRGRVYWLVKGPALVAIDADGGIPYEKFLGPICCPTSRICGWPVRITDTGRNARACALEVIASNDLVSPILASPAVVGGRIYLRTNSELVCIGIH